MVYLEKVQACK